MANTHATTRVYGSIASRALLAVIGMIAVANASAATQVSGSITQSTQWTSAGTPYVLSGPVTINNGAQLAIDAGVLVQMNPGAGLEVVDGALSAQGTAANPITITSASGSPARGDWGTLTFDSGTDSAATVLTHVNVRYGHGIAIHASSPSFHYVSIDHHVGPAIAIDLDSSPAGDHLTASDNDLNGILVPAGEIAHNVSWLLTGIPYVVQQGAVTVGKRSFSLAPSRLTVAQGATETFELDIPDPAPEGGLAIGTSSSNTAVAATPGSISVPAAAQTASLTVTGVALGSSTITASQGAYGNTTAIVDVVAPPTITLTPQSSTLGNAQSETITVTLSSVAPSAGVVVALAAADPTIVSLPSQIAIAVGQRTASFSVQALAVGTTSITASAPGWAPGSAAVAVHGLSLVLPPSIIVPPSGSIGSLVTLSDPAPPGGLTVTLSSSATSVATVPPTVFISVGNTSAAFAITGLAQGTANLTASAPGYASAASIVTVSAIGISFNPSSLALPQGQSQAVQVQLSKVAPAAVTVALGISDGTLASIWPSVVSIPAGQTTASEVVTVHGLSSLSRSNAFVSAQSPGLTSGSLVVTVEPPVAGLMLGYTAGSDSSQVVLGKGFGTGNVLLGLKLTDGSAWYGYKPMTVSLTSSDPTKVSVPATITLPSTNDVYLNAVAGLDITDPASPVALTASSPDWPSLRPLLATVVSPDMQFVGLDGNRSVTGGRNGFRASWSVPGGEHAPDANTGQTIGLAIVAADPAGIIPGFHDAASGGNPLSQVTLSAGATSSAFAYIDQPTTSGTYRVQATWPGVGTWVSDVQTVSNASLQFFDADPKDTTLATVVGKGLKTPQTQLSIGLVASANGQPIPDPGSLVSVTLTSSDPTKVTVTPSVATIAACCTSKANFTLVGVDVTSSPVTITASAAGYSAGQPLLVSVVTPNVAFTNLDNTRGTASNRDDFYLAVSTPGAYGTQVANAAQTIALSLAANPAGIVPGFHNSFSSGNVLTQLTLAAGNANSSTAYVDKPTANGTYQLQASWPGVGNWTSTTQTVASAGLALLAQSFNTDNPYVVGQGLANTLLVNALTNGLTTGLTGPLTVSLASSDPGKVSVPASITITQGNYQGAIPVTGVQPTAAPVLISAQADGYSIPTAFPVSVVVPQLVVGNVDAIRSVAGPREILTLRWTIPNSTSNQYAAQSQTFDLSVLGAIVPGFHDAATGGNAITQTTIPAGTNSNCCTTFVDSATAVGTYQIQASLQGAGSALSPLLSVINAAFSFGNRSGTSLEVVGSGMQASDMYIALSALYPPADAFVVSLACVDASICSVPSTVQIQPRQTSASFAVTGLAPGTTQIRATVPSDYIPPSDFTVSVVQPSLHFSGLASQVSLGASATFNVFVGSLGAYGLQNAPADVIVALSSSNPAVATVPPTVTVKAGTAVSAPIQVSGLAIGTTTITATAPGWAPETSQPVTVH